MPRVCNECGKRFMRIKGSKSLYCEKCIEKRRLRFLKIKNNK